MTDKTNPLTIQAYNALTNTVDARQLHKKLGIGKDFSTWIKDQINRADLIEHEDYEVLTQKASNKLGNHGGHNRVDYILSTNAVETICIFSQTPKGKQYRRYLIDLEKNHNVDPLKIRIYEMHPGVAAIYDAMGHDYKEAPILRIVPRNKLEEIALDNAYEERMAYALEFWRRYNKLKGAPQNMTITQIREAYLRDKERERQGYTLVPPPDQNRLLS